MKCSIFLVKNKVFGAWFPVSWGVILLKMGSWGLLSSLGGSLWPAASFSKRNKKSLIFLANGFSDHGSEALGREFSEIVLSPQRRAHFCIASF
jgi:hypothetical protein